MSFLPEFNAHWDMIARGKGMTVTELIYATMVGEYGYPKEKEVEVWITKVNNQDPVSFPTFKKAAEWINSFYGTAESYTIERYKGPESKLKEILCR